MSDERQLIRFILFLSCIDHIFIKIAFKRITRLIFSRENICVYATHWFTLSKKKKTKKNVPIKNG